MEFMIFVQHVLQPTKMQDTHKNAGIKVEGIECIAAFKNPILCRFLIPLEETIPTVFVICKYCLACKCISYLMYAVIQRKDQDFTALCSYS